MLSPKRSKFRKSHKGHLAGNANLAYLLAVGLAFFYRYGVSYPPRVKRRVWTGTFVAIGCWVLFFGLLAGLPLLRHPPFPLQQNSMGS